MRRLGGEETGRAVDCNAGKKMQEVVQNSMLALGHDVHTLTTAYTWNYPSSQSAGSSAVRQIMQIQIKSFTSNSGLGFVSHRLV